jgi:hypothetical protein
MNAIPCLEAMVSFIKNTYIFDITVSCEKTVCELQILKKDTKTTQLTKDNLNLQTIIIMSVVPLGT